MYRLLRSLQETGDRRKQRPAQHHAIPRLLATGPHDGWTWDITKLPLVRRGIYFFSRYVVAWMVLRKENSALAKQLMDEATAPE
jgi:putative transposase